MNHLMTWRSSGYREVMNVQEVIESQSPLTTLTICGDTKRNLSRIKEWRVIFHRLVLCIFICGTWLFIAQVITNLQISNPNLTVSRFKEKRPSSSIIPRYTGTCFLGFYFRARGDRLGIKKGGTFEEAGSSKGLKEKVVERWLSGRSDADLYLAAKDTSNFLNTLLLTEVAQCHLNIATVRAGLREIYYRNWVLNECTWKWLQKVCI